MNAELQSDPNIVEPQPPTSPPVQSEIITIGKGLTKAFLFDKRIVIFHLDTVARDIIDAGAKDVLETKHQYLVIYDITSAKIALTPHLRQRLQELAKAYPDLKGRSAVVLPRSVITQVFKLFVIAQNRVGRRKQVFFDRESAIAWLQQVMVDP